MRLTGSENEYASLRTCRPCLRPGLQCILKNLACEKTKQDGGHRIPSNGIRGDFVIGYGTLAPSRKKYIRKILIF